jgi:hypothetical protein
LRRVIFLVVVFNVVIYLPKREVMGLELASELPGCCVHKKKKEKRRRDTTLELGIW